MTGHVKRRPYDSRRRREQAAGTRRAILAAAQSLFERDGYAATSVPAIAGEAGVAVKTVYVAFETKASLLRQLWDQRLSGDEAGVEVTERQWYRGVADERDPVQKLRRVARQSRAVKTSSGALMQVIRDASPADPEIARLWDEIQAKLLHVSRSIVEQLHTADDLAGDDLAAAADRLWTLNHPSVWHLLVHERGWSAEQYERWLGDILCAELLKPSSRTPARSVSRK